MAYLLLSDLGLIGNPNSAAIVSRLGSVEWCCLPFLDSPSHFASLLDENHGGRFQIMPSGEFRSEQRYLQRTQILETLFETPTGRGVLTDWMSESGEPTIYRRVEVLSGRISWLVTCSPRFDYGSRAPQVEIQRSGAVLFRGQAYDELAELRSEPAVPFTPIGTPVPSLVEGKFTLESGESTSFSWGWGRGSRAVLPQAGLPTPRATADYWRKLAHSCPPVGCVFSGPWHDAVTRSGLLLRLLTNSYAGSIAESATTSLPGTLGGSRTWDYRFSWIRDSAFAMQALAELGYRDQARALFSWLSDVVIRDGPEALQPVYTLDGGRHLPERELAFLSGYQGSRPVRVGNRSAKQFSLDIFGHVMLAAEEYYRVFEELPEGLWPRLSELADHVCQVWRRPDHGVWEVRSRPEHFVSSKVYCWAALDRAIGLAGKLGFDPPHRWAEERGILHHTVCLQGFDREKNCFVRAFGSQDLDTSNLILPVIGFLPADDPRIVSTVTKLQQELSEGVLLRRYQSYDGLPGEDGAFLPASFLLVSCLAMMGKIDEASERMVELCEFATPLGIFGEQVDLRSGETAGNFPSASAHLALIHASLQIGRARGKQGLLRTELKPAPAAAATPGRTGGSRKLAFKNHLKLSYR